MRTRRVTNNPLVAALVAIAIVGGGVATNAHAGVLATSIQEITDFQIIDNSDGQPLDNNDDFTSLTFTTTADASASLNGSSMSDSASASSANPVDLAPQCVGDCPAVADNAFPMISSGLGDPTTTFAVADQVQDGSPITGLASPLGARASTASYVSIESGEQVGSADSNNGLASTFEFTLAKSTGVTFQFDAESYLEAFTSSDQAFPASALARMDIGFTLEDAQTGTELVDWEPNGRNNVAEHTGLNSETDPFDLSTRASRNAPFNGATVKGAALATKNSGSFSASTVSLPGGQPLRLTIDNNTDSDAQSVPSPGVLALMGIGLIGMGAATRRRRSTST